jgi:hypothetical protein
VLQGSLQTVAIPEVLQFLESTSKSGELTVSGSNGRGRLWFDSGMVSGFESRSSREPGEAVFELMGITDGEFVFTAADSGQPAQSARTTRRQVGPLLAEAEALREEWSEIVGVVASLDRFVELVADAPSDPVTLGRAQWAAVVAVGSGSRVAEVIAGCDLSEIAGCRVIRNLVEAGVATITERPAVVSEMDAPGATVAVEAISHDRLPAPAEDVAPAGETPQGDRVGILGFDFGTLVADFPVPAATASREESVDDEPERALVAPDVTYSDLNELPSSQGDFDTPETSAEDHYAALRAAMLEVGENLESTVGTGAADSAGYEDADSAGYGDAHGGYGASDFDALSDRGPWSESELAQIYESGTWDTDAGSADDRGSDDGSATAPHGLSGSSPEASDDPATEEAEGGEEPAEEPINRGLLLKFLSSVRN